MGSIEEITHSLPIVYGDMESLGVPLTKSPDPSLSASKSRKLGALHGSDVGFGIRKLMRTNGSYDLASVFITVDLNDWEEYLPFDLGDVKSKTRVTVLRPTKKNRAVRLEVFLSVPMATSSMKIQGPRDAASQEKRSLDLFFAARC